jgi:hypothetical protein
MQQDNVIIYGRLKKNKISAQSSCGWVFNIETTSQQQCKKKSTGRYL